MAKSRSKTKASRKPVKKARAASARKPAKAGKARGRNPRHRGSGKGKWVYAFGGGKAAGRASMRNLLGGKGAGLAEMAHLGLPVPPGFTITTEVCTYFYEHGKTYPKDLKAQVEAALAAIGRITGKKFGDDEKSAARLGALRRPRLDAGHDGHRAQSRSQRRHGRGACGKIRRPALRLGQLPALHHHVFRRGARHRASEFRGNPRRAQRAATAIRSTPISTPTICKRWSTATRSASSRNWASRFRRIRTRNCGAPSARCSARG